MNVFKVGDKIRRTAPGMHYEGMHEGDVYTVKAVEDMGRPYQAIQAEGKPYWYSSDNFTLVAQEGGSVQGETTAVVPAHYAFPGGVRVHQISGHLTSFGGQALQYIARSTRLDGNNKGDTVENLRKAIRFLELEIERVGGGDA